MKKHFILLLLLILNSSCGTNMRSPSSDEDDNNDKAITPTATIKSVTMDTNGDDDLAALTSEIQIKFTGKTLDQVANKFMDISVFDDMAEISRIAEGDKARQATTKNVITANSYVLVKSSWLNLGMKYSLGDTKAICGFSKDAKVFSSVCKSDQSHKGTKLRMSKLESILRCDAQGSEVNCKINLTLLPKKMTVLGKTITANEVAMLGGVQAVRLNSAMAHSLITKTNGEAYIKYNYSKLEEALTKFKDNFHVSEKAHSFKFPEK